MDLRAAIADERRRVADLVDSLQPNQLDAPSLCGEWTVKEVAGHLLAACGNVKPSLGLIARSGFRLHVVNARLAVQTADRPAAELAQALRDNADNPFEAPLVGHPGQLTDLQVHSQDMRRPLGLPHGLRLERLRVSLDFMTSGRAYGFAPRRRLSGLRFEASDLNWFSGVGELVVGPAEAVLLAMCGRTAVLGELDGPGVRTLRSRLH
ncbi:maleylpyruvate isomerase family mycothiol-dependent enzyme [Symbioplanes lichenis]|uniref:maleylpyruvate isomerase family mycothiol-dependent enzyme n=1 Tax=Symbioplanes lichenis TaxID=1629072 RepID=UPI002738204F|nr:maleylpyruvate isomerase family mycothiol-dependent enzyme [Actinoplanes lichenis]